MVVESMMPTGGIGPTYARLAASTTVFGGVLRRRCQVGNHFERSVTDSQLSRVHHPTQPAWLLGYLVDHCSMPVENHDDDFVCVEVDEVEAVPLALC